MVPMETLGEAAALHRRRGSSPDVRLPNQPVSLHQGSSLVKWKRAVRRTSAMKTNWSFWQKEEGQHADAS